MRPNVLVIGGTAQSTLLADRLVNVEGMHVVTSIAGRAQAGAPPAGDVRIGEFEDAGALAQFVRERRLNFLVDASDAFDERASALAAEAAMICGVQRLVLTPATWPETDDDVWIRVRHSAEAADLLPGLGTRVLLDLPTDDVDAFARLTTLWFGVRLPSPANEALPLDDYLIIAPAPADVTAAREESMLRQHGIDLVITRDTGAASAWPLMQAARQLSLPVLLLQRPPPPPSCRADTVDEAVQWLHARLREMSTARAS